MAPASAYKVDKGIKGGTIEGAVKFAGKASAMKPLEVNKNKEVCGKKPVPNQTLVVGGNGGLEWAVVRLIDVKTGKAWSKKVWGKKKSVIDQNGCYFSPHVLVIKPKRGVRVLNNDKILHNFHTFPKKNKAVNKAQPKFLKKMNLKGSFFKTPEIINVKCDVHGWMNGYIVVAENPYTTVTNAEGKFKLTNVPPGDYKLEVWQESLGTSVQSVTVKAKETTNVTVTMKK
jgi:plastocyanin